MQKKNVPTLLVDAEAKKIEAFVGKNGNFPSEPTCGEILEFSHSVNQLVDTLLMKEWLLLKKLETVVHIKKRYNIKNKEEASVEDVESEE
ncbi:hypothetical protein [Bacillus sp. FJAT-45350]|uniref:hypothetical protein n=1 Tax=Bacillus sp. FJAT-45350 TaxID=2011014 RepID=UPI000BB6BA13|nr:hypothetical protein [Bacillus sp. FJAT-45350]